MVFENIREAKLQSLVPMDVGNVKCERCGESACWRNDTSCFIDGKRVVHRKGKHVLCLSCAYYWLNPNGPPVAYGLILYEEKFQEYLQSFKLDKKEGELKDMAIIP